MLAALAFSEVVRRAQYAKRNVPRHTNLLHEKQCWIHPLLHTHQQPLVHFVSGCPVDTSIIAAMFSHALLQKSRRC